MVDSEQVLECKEKTMVDSQKTMEDSQQSLEYNEKTMVDSQQTLDGNRQIMDDSWQRKEEDPKILEDNHRTMKKNDQTSEDNQKTLEDVHPTLKDNQQTLEYNEKTMVDSQHVLDDNRQTLDDNRQTLDDNWKRLEDNETLDDNWKRSEDNQDTFEDVNHTLEDNQLTMNDYHKTMKNNLQLNNPVFPCDECGKFFSEKEKLRNHKSYTHRIEVSVCSICGNEFQNKQKLQKHINARHKDKEIHCDMCVKVFKNHSDLYGHKKKVHEVNENLSCSRCGTKMMNVFKLKRHLRKWCRGYKITQGDLNCIECNKTFESLKAFNGHNKFVHSYDLVKCPICQNDSKNISCFRQHLNRAHKIIDPTHILNLIKHVKPDFEGMKRNDNSSHEKNSQDSSNLSEYQKHRIYQVKKWREIEKEQNDRINSQKVTSEYDENNQQHGIELLTPDIKLEEGFNVKLEASDEIENSIEHKDELCTNKQGHKCLECGKIFSRGNRLNGHIKLVHTYEPCTCPYCDKTLKNESYLSAHIRKAHQDKLPKEEINTVNKKIIDKSYSNFLEAKQNNRIDVIKEEIQKSPTEMQNIGQESVLSVCNECGKSFSNVEKLNDHVKTEHIFEPCTCPFCEGTVLKNKTYLIKHLEQFHKGYGLPKQINDRVEEGEIKMNQYRMDGLSEVKNEADIEIKQENTEIPIKQEIADTDEEHFGFGFWFFGHTNEKPFKCNLCSQTFTTKRVFEEHKLIHTGEKPFQCDDCGKLFRIKDFLKMHIKTFHSNKKQFMCDTCSKTFITITKLEQHKRIHTGEKPFQCDECGASFRLKFVMKKHKKNMHRADKGPLICKICARTFKHKGTLETHERAHANEGTPSICDICHKTFSSVGKLKVHKRTHSEQSSQLIDHLCPQCGKSFKSKMGLGGHIATAHPSEKQGRLCSFCGQEFKNAAGLKGHQRKHITSSQTGNTGIYKCLECNKEFPKKHALYVHNYSTHTVQNIPCPTCGKICKNKVALNKHIKRTCVSSPNYVNQRYMQPYF